MSRMKEAYEEDISSFRSVVKTAEGRRVLSIIINLQNPLTGGYFANNTFMQSRLEARESLVKEVIGMFVNSGCEHELALTMKEDKIRKELIKHELNQVKEREEL